MPGCRLRPGRPDARAAARPWLRTAGRARSVGAAAGSRPPPGFSAQAQEPLALCLPVMRVWKLIVGGIHARPACAADQAAQARLELHWAAAGRTGFGDEMVRGHVGGTLTAGFQVIGDGLDRRA